MGLPDLKLQKIHRLWSSLLSQRFTTCKSLHKILGHIAAAFIAVPLLHLHSCYLQSNLYRKYTTTADLNRSVPFSGLDSRPLVDSRSSSGRLLGSHLAVSPGGMRSDGDDGLFGWGIYVEGRLYSGEWDAATAPLHINVKELMTLRIFFTDYLQLCSPQPRSLLWKSDNTTALAYTGKEGGLRSLPLLKVAREVLLLCKFRRIRITSAFVSTDENILADAASRNLQVADWHLLPSTFRRLSQVFWIPKIDLFASQASAQVPRFISWNKEDSAEWFDALCLL